MTSSQAHSVSVSLPNVIVNVELHAAAGHYLDRLECWRTLFDAAVASKTDPDAARRVRHSVYRYEKLWLPLLAKWQQQQSSSPLTASADLEPPTDVAWVWHLHQLRPQHYYDYCCQRYKRVLPHRVRPLRGPDAHQAVEQTTSAWNKSYPGIPFNYTGDTTSGGSNMATVPDQKLAEMLIGVVAQQEFDLQYHVAMPHIRDPNFLYISVERYRKWLLLRQMRPEDARVIRVLPVDIQLVGRVHALHPVQYAADLARLFNPSTALSNCVTTTSVTSEPDVQPAAIEKANAVWRSMFRGEKLFISGTGCRGRLITPCPLVEFPRDQLPSAGDRQHLDSCDIVFTAVTVEELWSRSKRVVVEARLLGENSLALAVVFRTSGPVGATLTGNGTAGTLVSNGTTTPALGSTRFDSHGNRGVELVVYGKQGFACFTRSQRLATKQFNPLQSATSGGQTTVTLPKVTYTDPKITIGFTIQGASQKPTIFTLDRNPPTLGPFTTELRQLVGPSVGWSTLITSADSLFVRAKHLLKCRDGGNILLGVEVLKHERTNMAAVMLYHNSKELVAASYSIDADQLPDPCQVSETCPITFDVQEGDHAMLIRSGRGDYGIVAARWEPNNNVTHSSSGCDGSVVYRLYLSATKQTVKFSVSEDEMQSIKLSTIDGNMEIDLPTGRMTVDSSVIPLPEYLTLAFSIGVLFVTILKNACMQVNNKECEKCAIRDTLIPRRLLSTATLCAEADGRLFSRIVNNQQHLHPLFPPIRSRPHYLRDRPHKYELPPSAESMSGSVRSAHSGPSGGRSSPVASEVSSNRSAASRLANKFNASSSTQNISQRKKATKRRKMSASFTFLLACGFQIDVALGSGAGSVRLGVDVGQQHAQIGRQANGVVSPGNGHVQQTASDQQYLDVRF